MIKEVKIFHKNLKFYGDDEIDIYALGMPRKRKSIRKKKVVKLELVKNNGK